MPPPLSLRTDAMGIFTVLFISGLAQLLTRAPGSVLEVVPEWVASIWVGSLVVFGLLGLSATLLPRRLRILGMAVEGVSRAVLGSAALVYAVAVYEAVGLDRGLFAFLTYLGMAGLLLVGAVQIARWLRAQRAAVDRVLETGS